MQAATELKLHIGCGPGEQPDDWINIDGSWNAWLSKHTTLMWMLIWLKIAPKPRKEIIWRTDVVIHNITRRLPYTDNSVHAIYAAHVLEHLYLNQGVDLLRECFRVLSPGGVLRIVVPDLLSIAKEYIGDGTNPAVSKGLAADRVNSRLLFREAHPPRGNIFYRLYSAMNDFHSHKWMYDEYSLIKHFREAGFDDVASRGFRESAIIDIARLERSDRLLDGAGICVEAIKQGPTPGQ